MKTILVTGFEPFGGDERNPSQEIVHALDGRVIAGRHVVASVLPCAFAESLKRLRALLRRHGPQLVICLGLAGGRQEITPERVAINVDDARIADNAGAQPIDKPIVRVGPAAYWSTLPVKAIVAALKRRGIPASVSQTAGTFVCNHVFYGLMHELRRKRSVRGGFIHVPWPADWKRTDGSPIPLRDMISAIEIAIEVSLRQRKDMKRAGGREE
jgi:pyroglutamyl-peptidase